jgi:L-ascorbate metabolism protein UlaG (beta-lactamase superfamily)
MVITYHGGECFKVSQGDLTLAFNPPSKDSKLKMSKFGSDIVLSSLNNEDLNGTDTASLGDREPFVVEGPGEYDVKGVSIHGFGSQSHYGDGKEHLNTIYKVTLEGMNLCYLGALDGALPPSAKVELDDVDILFVPIGGDGVLDYSAGYKLAVQLEPKAIIPMHYGADTGIGSKDALKQFLKEAGVDGLKPVDRLTLKKKDLEGKEAEIIVVSSV